MIDPCPLHCEIDLDRSSRKWTLPGHSNQGMYFAKGGGKVITAHYTQAYLIHSPKATE